jgi:predicted ArsR family transcriptional regulator
MGPIPSRHTPSDAGLSRPRAQVLEFLQQTGSAVSVEQTADHLRLHPNTARKHLLGLVTRGLATSELLPSGARGRPARQYAASRDAEPDLRIRDYAGLATALAGQISRSSAHPHSDAEAAGEAWGRVLAEDIPVGRGQRRARRAVIELLARLGFEPDTDASATSVRLRRCPLLDAARAYPDVICPVHLGVIRGALAAWGGRREAATLVPFAEPGACLVQLGPTSVLGR